MKISTEMMAKRSFAATMASALAIVLGVSAAPQSGAAGMQVAMMMGQGMRANGDSPRRQYYRRNGAPAPYRGKASPLAPTPADIREGATLYADNCAACHGARGLGDGEDGRELNPRPSNLAGSLRMRMLRDDFVLWTVAEGGERFGSAMPPFKDALFETEIWKILAAMRAGFPPPQ